MKKRTRRFEQGGSTEEQDKAAGLKASAAEDVGFFKRLAMGNIDDPTSEAYARFGAGRGRAERARSAAPEEAAVVPPRPAAPARSESRGDIKPVVVDYGSDEPAATPEAAPAKRKEPARAPMRASKPEPAARPMRTATPSRDMDEAGHLMARPMRPDSGMGPKNTFITPERAAAAARAYGAGWDKKMDRPLIDLSDRPMTPREREREAMLQRDAEARRDAVMNRKPVPVMQEPDEYEGMTPAQKSRARGDKLRAALGFKKGGAVSSVSRRADGIAQRGKTRGRIC